MLILITGNFVAGFTGYVLPDDLEAEEVGRLVGHVPESRSVVCEDIEALFEKYGPLPEPANVEPKTTISEPVDELADGPEELDDDAGGPVDGEDSGPADGGQGPVDDGAPQ